MLCGVSQNSSYEPGYSGCPLCPHRINAMRAARLLRISGFLIATACAVAQSDDSVRGLVTFLSRPASALEAMGLEGGCPTSSEDRSAAISLSEQGDSAIPEIEKAISLMERGELQSEHSAWLLYAYAKVRGAAAYPRIAAMAREERLSSLEPTWDRLIALSLSLTSYVSESHTIPALKMADGRLFFCRKQEPRDALDKLIVAWMNNDRRSLEGSLGTKARTILDSQVTHETGIEWRAMLKRSKTITSSSVGYLFGVSGRWSDPEEPLTSGVATMSVAMDKGEFDLDTKFTDSTGKECGRRPIRFVHSSGASQGSLDYLIDAADIDGLLELISACAANRAQK